MIYSLLGQFSQELNFKYPKISARLLKLDLLEKFSFEVKEQIINGKEKGLSKPYRASLINLLARLSDKKWALIKMEEDKNKTPEMLAEEAKEDSEAAWRLHKKFQSGREIKA